MNRSFSSSATCLRFFLTDCISCCSPTTSYSAKVAQINKRFCLYQQISLYFKCLRPTHVNIWPFSHYPLIEHCDLHRAIRNMPHLYISVACMLTAFVTADESHKTLCSQANVLPNQKAAGCVM